MLFKIILFIYALQQSVNSYQNYRVTKLGPCTAQLDDGRIIDLGIFQIIDYLIN